MVDSVNYLPSSAGMPPGDEEHTVATVVTFATNVTKTMARDDRTKDSTMGRMLRGTWEKMDTFPGLFSSQIGAFKMGGQVQGKYLL